MDCHVISLLLFYGTLPRQYPLLDDFLYLLRVLLDFVSCSYRAEKLGSFLGMHKDGTAMELRTWNSRNATVEERNKWTREHLRSIPDQEFEP